MGLHESELARGKDWPLLSGGAVLAIGCAEAERLFLLILPALLVLLVPSALLVD